MLGDLSRLLQVKNDVKTSKYYSKSYVAKQSNKEKGIFRENNKNNNKRRQSIKLIDIA